MNISSLTSSSAAQQLQRPAGPPPGGGPEKTAAAVADLLGMDTDVAAQLSATQNRGAVVDGWA